jgi:hypothetical protein
MTMRSTGLLLWIGGVLLSACTSDTTPAIYIDMGWQVRCLNCERTAQDDPARAVKNVSGENGLTLKCDVRKVSGTRRVEFSIDHPSSNQDDKYGIDLALGDLDSSDPSDACVTVREGDNTYSYMCPNEDDAFTNPCQASFSVKDNIISGTVICEKIPNSGTNELTRSVVAPGSRTDGASFKLYGCAGL